MKRMLCFLSSVVVSISLVGCGTDKASQPGSGAGAGVAASSDLSCTPAQVQSYEMNLQQAGVVFVVTRQQATPQYPSGYPIVTYDQNYYFSVQRNYSLVQQALYSFINAAQPYVSGGVSSSGMQMGMSNYCMATLYLKITTADRLTRSGELMNGQMGIQQPRLF